MCVVSFDLINMIFDEKLLIGENVDFLWVFVFVQEESELDCGFGNWDGRLVKVLIFVGFDDIGCDMDIFGWMFEKWGFQWGLWDFCCWFDF